MTTRLTRAASQARTREQLVATATELFLRDGYFATSLDKVAEAAGYSKGAVYSNFRSKDELCLAVLDAQIAQRAVEVAMVVGGTQRLSEKLAAFETWADSVIADPGWSTLEIELASQARTDPALRAAFARRAAAMRAAIAAMITAVTREAGIEMTVAPEELAVTVLGAGLGLALQRAFDPSVSARALTATIRAAAGLPLTAAQGAAPQVTGP